MVLRTGLLDRRLRRIRVPTRSCSGSPSSTGSNAFRDRQLDPQPMREVAQNRGGRQPSTTIPICRTASSGSVPCAISSPARRLRPDLRPARDDEVAHAREAGERLLLAAGAPRRGGPSRRGRARSSAAFGVVAELEAVGATGGERDHVLRRRAQLDADDVVVDVDAERRRELIAACSSQRELLVVARDHRRRRQPSRRSPPRCSARRARRPDARGRASTGARPVAGSRPLVSERTGASPGAISTTYAEHARSARRATIQLGVFERRRLDRGRRDRRAGRTCVR
mgnify:CR=1 FL=1